MLKYHFVLSSPVLVSVHTIFYTFDYSDKRVMFWRNFSGGLCGTCALVLACGVKLVSGLHGSQYGAVHSPLGVHISA